MLRVKSAHTRLRRTRRVTRMVNSSEELAPPAIPAASSGAAARVLTAGPSDDAVTRGIGSGFRRDAQSELTAGDNIGVCRELLNQDKGALKAPGVYQVRPVAALPREEAATEQCGKDETFVKDVIKDKDGGEWRIDGELEDGKAVAASPDTSRKADRARTQDADATRDVVPPAANPVRIVVRCLSHEIPGPRRKRKVTIADMVCRQYFQRDYDPAVDKISVMGLEDIDGKKVRFLLESGTLSDSTAKGSVSILAFRWTGEQLVSREVTVRTRAYLDTLPFKYIRPSPATKSRAKSSTEMRDGMTDEEWNQYMQELLKRKLQLEKTAGSLIKSWSREHPDMFFDVMQEYAAQKRWHKLVLTPAERQWVDAEKDRDQPASFLALMEMVLERMGIDTA